MELENTGQEEMDLGFTPVADGTYVYQLMDGVELRLAGDSDAKTLMLPLKVDSIVEGDADAVGMPANMFVNIIKKDGEENPFGGKTINNILTMTGLADSFIKNFGDEKISVDDETFINALILKLPGKFLRLTHNVVVEKDDAGNERKNMNWTKMAAIKKKKAAQSESKAKKDDSKDDTWVD